MRNLDNLNNIPFPEISKGTIIPNGILEQQIEEAKEKELQKQQWRHDFRIALFSAVSGGIAGFITSAILLHMQGLL